MKNRTLYKPELRIFASKALFSVVQSQSSPPDKVKCCTGTHPLSSPTLQRCFRDSVHGRVFFNSVELPDNIRLCLQAPSITPLLPKEGCVLMAQSALNRHGDRTPVLSRRHAHLTTTNMQTPANGDARKCIH